jgi:dihydrofolate reductase
VFVFSHTLITVPHPGVLAADIEATVSDLRKQPGRDIWLFGGASLCASMLSAGLVDRIEVAVVPIVLGRGIPLVAANALRAQLTLLSSAVSPSGIVNLQYDVERMRHNVR